MSEKTKIVLILGYPKSGSTVFGELIGQFNEFLHVGEMERLWCTTEDKISLFPIKDCSCGERLYACTFWKPYLNSVVERIKELNKAQDLDLNNRKLLDYRERLLMKKKFSEKEAKIYTDLIHLLYKSLYEGEKKIILDSSKDLWYAQYLESTNLFDISYIHLARDLKGVIYSRQKKLKTYNQKSGKISLDYKYVAYDIVKWNIANYKIKRFLSNKKSTFVCYEEMVNNPHKALERIGELMNLNIDPSMVLNDNKEFFIHENHLIHGNRFRKERGLIKLKKDPRPYNELKLMDKKLINGLMPARYQKI